MNAAGHPARWELFRALGAALATPPPHNAPVLDALGLPAQSGAEHTAMFVLSAPPHAAIHLGPEGKLGGAGLDRVAGFWRVLGLPPPEDADHLGVLMMLYAELGDAEDHTAASATRRTVAHTRRALFAEHLVSWAPAYLRVVADQGAPAVAAWARLASDALREEAGRLDIRQLPAALRDSPDPLDRVDDPSALLDALLAPARSGVLLTRADVERCGAATDLGLRRGERRYAIRAYLEQDPHATLAWLAAHARRWSVEHAAVFPVPVVGRWWRERAARTAAALGQLLEPAMANPGTAPGRAQ